jgi:predicted regulator of amino acid metabolism with ACT domain
VLPDRTGRRVAQVGDQFQRIMEQFEDSPSQQAVVRLLLERGFSVNEEGRVVSGGIEIPDTQIARELDIDRRVVDSTTDAILADAELRPIFRNISSIPSLRDLAPVLDLTVLTVEVHDADESGIVATVTAMIADRDVSIRQTITEDPEFTDEPKLYVITGEALPGDLFTELKDLEFVRRVGIE